MAVGVPLVYVETILKWRKQGKALIEPSYRTDHFRKEHFSLSKLFRSKETSHLLAAKPIKLPRAAQAQASS